MRRTPNKLIDVLDRIYWNRVIIYHLVSVIPLVFIQCVVDNLLLGFYIDNTFQFELNFSNHFVFTLIFVDNLLTGKMIVSIHFA